MLISMLLIPLCLLLAHPEIGRPAQTDAVERRVSDLLGKMTLDEKISMLGGVDDFYVRALPRLGIPAIKMSDGPMGLRNDGPATAFPAGVTMASTWDRDLARNIGMAFGDEARARGVHVLLTPGLNIDRVAMCGRNFEYLGEDPYLASQMVVPFVKGVQERGVIATPKHYAMNNQEFERQSISSEVDERTMNEIYLPAFKAAIQDGGAWSIMASYNRVNGVYAAHNKTLLTDILKNRWGFKGFAMSDWGAVSDGVAAATAGLDLEMPGPDFMTPATIHAALDDGRLSAAAVDDKVRRMLRAFVSMGFLDRPQKTDAPRETEAQRSTALQGAREGIVLLSNPHECLPFDRTKIKRIAVFGPNASPAVTGGGGSSQVMSIDPVSTLDGIKAVGKVETDFLPFLQANRMGAYRSSKFMGLDGVSPGLDGEYFNNPDLTGTALYMRRDEHIWFDWSGKAPFDGGKQTDYSVRWRGFIVPDQTAAYEFSARSDDGSRLYIDDKLVIDMWRAQAETEDHATVNLVKRHKYKVRFEYFQGIGNAAVALGYTARLGRTFDKEIAAAKADDAAVVCVGFGPGTESEGADRSFGLPEGQDALIEAVCKANPRTVVVVNSGGGVDMEAWKNLPGAIVQAWYPGSLGGTALAEILFGEVNPSGKLAATFDPRVEDGAAYGNYPGKDGKVFYKEGVFVGYRHYEHAGVKPAFAFGHGLSYTTFGFSNLNATASGNHADVSFWVTNTGKRAGAEVAQVYVGEVSPTVARPVKELKQFARLVLAPGERRHVSMRLDRSAFAFYSVAIHDWKANPGKYRIYVGAASDDVRLQSTVSIAGG